MRESPSLVPRFTPSTGSFIVLFLLKRFFIGTVIPAQTWSQPRCVFETRPADDFSSVRRELGQCVRGTKVCSWKANNSNNLTWFEVPSIRLQWTLMVLNEGIHTIKWLWGLPVLMAITPPCWIWLEILMVQPHLTNWLSNTTHNPRTPFTCFWETHQTQMLDLGKCAKDSCRWSKNKPLKSWHFKWLLAPSIHRSLHQILTFCHSPVVSQRCSRFKAPAVETKPPSRGSKGLSDLPGNNRRLHPSCLI